MFIPEYGPKTVMYLLAYRQDHQHGGGTIKNTTEAIIKTLLNEVH